MIGVLLGVVLKGVLLGCDDRCVTRRGAERMSRWVCLRDTFILIIVGYVEDVLIGDVQPT